MASPSTQWDLTCPVCYDIFKHPLVLPCSHSVCEGCLQKWWTAKPTKRCPVCQTLCSQDKPPVNLALKNMCETFQHRAPLCKPHGEPLRLFCLKDKQLACLVCRDSEKHARHKFKPINEAAQCLREELLMSVTNIMEELENSAKCNHDHAAKHIKEQAKRTEMEIKREFKKIRQFLHQEEEDRISALREEEREKSRTMMEKIEWMNIEMAALSNTIRDVEALSDDVSFLQNYKATVERVQRRLPDPLPLPENALIDVARHLGNLSYSIWDKLKDSDIVSYTPVILNPNTARQGLFLSDDLTSVYCDDTQLCNVPDVPERFHESVLGSKGFSSGSHSWDVEVGDNVYWELGVLEEEEPKEAHGGPCCRSLALINGTYLADYYNYSPLSSGVSENPTEVSSSGSATELSVNQKPRRIRVHLDWERGELSFSDPDSNAHLHTFTHPFTAGRVFPYIHCDDTTHPLKVLTGKVCVSLEDHS